MKRNTTFETQPDMETRRIMRAITADTYGGPEVLKLRELPRPVIGDDDVLVRVWAAALHAGDRFLLNGEPFAIRFMAGLKRPKEPVPGGDLAGVVTAVGKNVRRFQIGDAVFGGRDGFTDYGGALADFCRVPENKLELKPENVSFEEAAATGISGSTALAGLRKAGLAAGQQVLINGASGGVGSFAVQIAKACGAEVTAVCTGGKAAFVRGLGADHVIDYNQVDYTIQNQKWDLVFDAACFRPVQEARRAAQADGSYIMIGGSTNAPFAAMALGIWAKLSGGPRVLGLACESSPALLRDLSQFLSDNAVRPAIDRTFPLKDAAEAFGYLCAGHTQGKVVITIA